MTLRHMKIFVTVYRHSNITRAAEELHLAQPSVSLAVKELEEYYVFLKGSADAFAPQKQVMNFTVMPCTLFLSLKI